MEYLNINPILDNVLEISSGKNSWDLRNDADFKEVSFNVLENSVTLIWQFPSLWYKKEHKKEEPKIFLKFIFEKVDFIEIDSSDLYGMKSDITILEDVLNYYEKKDGSFDNNNFITFEFGNGLKIIIKAETLRFQELKEQ